MTSHQYRTALAHLSLSQARAATILGIGLRTSQAYASGELQVPKSIALFLELAQLRDAPAKVSAALEKMLVS